MLTITMGPTSTTSCAILEYAVELNSHWRFLLSSIFFFHIVSIITEGSFSSRAIAFFSLSRPIRLRWYSMAPSQSPKVDAHTDPCFVPSLLLPRSMRNPSSCFFMIRKRFLCTYDHRRQATARLISRHSIIERRVSDELKCRLNDTSTSLHRLGSIAMALKHISSLGK